MVPSGNSYYDRADWWNDWESREHKVFKAKCYPAYNRTIDPCRCYKVIDQMERINGSHMT